MPNFQWTSNEIWLTLLCETMTCFSIMCWTIYANSICSHLHIKCSTTSFGLFRNLQCTADSVKQHLKIWVCNTWQIFRFIQIFIIKEPWIPRSWGLVLVIIPMYIHFAAIFSWVSHKKWRVFFMYHYNLNGKCWNYLRSGQKDFFS